MPTSTDRKRTIAFVVLCLLATTILMTPVGAHLKKGAGHLWRTHVKPRLAKQGTINKPKNPVHWTRLKGVPAGLADGSDDGGGGGGGGGGDVITGVTAGWGLVGGGTSGDITLGADPAQVQTRVTGTCAAQSSMRTIKVNGTVECELDDTTAAFSGFKNGVAIVPTPMATIGKLDLPAGQYVILAKLCLVPPSLAGSASIECKLSAGPDSDYVHVSMEERDSDFMALNVVHDFASPGTASVACNRLGSSNPNTQYHDLRITAIRVNSLTNNAGL